MTALEQLQQLLPAIQAEAKTKWGESRTLNLEETKKLGYKGGLGAGVQTIGWKDYLKKLVTEEV